MNIIYLKHIKNAITFLIVSSIYIFFITPKLIYALETKPIIIAHVSPTSGRFSIHSEADKRGVELAIKEYNDKGGVLNRPIILIQYDPTLDTKKAAQVAEELINVNKISFMAGAVNSGVATSMSEVCQKYGVIFINTNSSAPSQAVEHAHRTKFVFDANGANYYKSLLKYSFDKAVNKNVILLTEDNQWGKSNAEAVKPFIQEYQGNIVKEILVSPDLNNPLELVNKIKEIDAQTVIVNISGNNQVKLFAQISPETFDKQSWIVGEIDWEDLYLVPGNIRPLFGVNWSWNLDNAETKKFVKIYRDRYSNTKLDYPGHVTYSAYLSTKALLDAIIKVNSTNNHLIIKELEKYRATASERMQDSDAYMDAKSHHLQQSTYIATWRPDIKNPQNSIKILGHITPLESRYVEEDNTKLESFDQTPIYEP